MDHAVGEVKIAEVQVAGLAVAKAGAAKRGEDRAADASTTKWDVSALGGLSLEVT